MIRWLGGKWLRLLALRPDENVMPRPGPPTVFGPAHHKYDFSGNYHSRGELTADQRATIGRLREAAWEEGGRPLTDADLTPDDLAELNRLRNEIGEYSFEDWHQRGGERDEP